MNIYIFSKYMFWVNNLKEGKENSELSGWGAFHAHALVIFLSFHSWNDSFHNVCRVVNEMYSQSMDYSCFIRLECSVGAVASSYCNNILEYLSQTQAKLMNENTVCLESEFSHRNAMHAYSQAARKNRACIYTDGMVKIVKT